MAGPGIKTKQMRIVGQHIEAGTPQCDAAIVMRRSIVHQTFRNGARVMPDLSASAGIERERIVSRSDKHQAVDYDGRTFETIGVLRMEDPLRLQLRDICRIELREAGL